MSYGTQHYVTLPRCQPVFPILACLFKFKEVLAAHRNCSVSGSHRPGKFWRTPVLWNVLHFGR